jgi:hypothetical protein
LASVTTKGISEQATSYQQFAVPSARLSSPRDRLNRCLSRAMRSSM